MATVRLNTSTHRILQELAERLGEPMQALLAAAIEQYRRQRLLEEHNATFTELRADKRAWQEEKRERALWERTLLDGLDE